ncbi:hypothetical protein ABZ345_26540 [Lentzea sp. NPDC005914]|uniref:hypothetical protein n=1 Tax=Lentzea sp. NPDC005914 TaxID=3154572 RepID=UPI0033DD9619
MELKQAMEAATADLDVRPGFVGDVMAGARLRHTRRLLTATAVVALIAGVTTGVVLTRSPSDPPVPGPVSGDARLTAATGGDQAGNAELIQRSLTAWGKPTTIHNLVTEISPDAHVFWAGSTPEGRVSLIAQSVRLPGSTEPHALVGLVHDDTVVDQEIVYNNPGNQLSISREQGIYRLGSNENATYVVLSLGQKVFWSAKPVRGQDLRYSRQWQEAPFEDGVAVVTARPADKPVFIRTDTGPPTDNVNHDQDRIVPRQEARPQTTGQPQGGLGWRDAMWASSRQDLLGPVILQKTVSDDLKQRGYLDYGLPLMAWEVRAWLPDGRFAAVTETPDGLLGALYQADGTFERVLPGGPVVKGTPVPVRLALPDGQGTILADRGALLGPEERENAWLAPPGTTEVAVWRSGQQTVVPL